MLIWILVDRVLQKSRIDAHKTLDVHDKLTAGHAHFLHLVVRRRLACPAQRGWWNVGGAAEMFDGALRSGRAGGNER